MATEENCPVCFIEYGEQSDGSFICCDGKSNSDYKTNCKHYFCVHCIKTMFKYFLIEIKGQQRAKGMFCPLCREDWTSFIINRYEDDKSSDDEDD